MNYKLFIISIILFTFIDYLYLSSISAYFSQIVKKITKEEMEFNMIKAIGAYIFLLLGLYYFIIKDLTKENLSEKIQSAFILGLVIYGTYDFTNGAVFKDYGWPIMILDTLWGGILYSFVTWSSYNLSTLI